MEPTILEATKSIPASAADATGSSCEFNLRDIVEEDLRNGDFSIDAFLLSGK